MTPTHPDTPTATRLLACALLDEALVLLGAVPAAVRPPPLPVRLRRTTGHPVLWDAAAIVTAIQAFQTRRGRPPARAEWREATRHQLPARETVCLVFGCLEAAYVASGYVLPASRRGQGEVRHVSTRMEEAPC